MPCEPDMELTINELARRTRLPPDTVRYYARIGLIEPAGRKANGYKQFSPQDIAKLKFVRQAKSLGFTLTEIRGILMEASSGASPCPQVREIITQRKASISEKNRMAISILHSRGIFDIKGSVDIVAKELGVSRYTVYNYLKEVKYQADGK